MSVGKVKLTPYLFALRKEHAVDNESRKLICLTYPSADQSKMNPHAEFQGYANPKENPWIYRTYVVDFHIYKSVRANKDDLVDRNHAYYINLSEENSDAKV